MISIVIPIYNEEKVVRKTIKDIQDIMASVSVSHEIIAINDGSKDKTAKILNEIKGIKVINHPYNMGYGASLKDGIKIAEGDRILIIDADSTYPAKKIPELIKYSKKYDMVVGSRKTENVPLIRKPAKKILSMLANFLTGKNIPDLNSGFRIFKKDIAMEFFHLFPSGFSFTTTITLACLTNDYSVRYIPTPYHKRVGKSSIKPWDFFSFIALIVRIMMYFRPLKFFLFPGIFLLLAGAIWGIYQFITIKNIAQFPVLLVIAGLQICFLGLIADLIVKSRGTK